MYGNVIEWEQSAWVATDWEGYDQAPVFLASLRSGDEIIALYGDHVTTYGVFGVGPTAAAPFIVRLIDTLSGGDSADIDIDFASREGMRTDELPAIIESLHSSGRAHLTGKDHGVFSVESGQPLQQVVGFLTGSNLNYMITLGDLRLAERDAEGVLIAGSSVAIERVWVAVEQVAGQTGMELKPLLWDL